MRILRPWVFLFALVVLAPAALADEIIHFTNGTSLPVLSHTIQDGMIKVDLGDAAVMAFPEYLVERIEGTKKNIAGLGYESNLRQGGSGGKSDRGAGQAIPDFNAIREIEILELPEDVKMDSRTGLVTHRPFAGSAASNRRKMQNAGNMRARTARVGSGSAGSVAVRRMGGKTVINKNAPGRATPLMSKQKVRPTLAHPGGAPPIAEPSQPPAEAAEDSGSSN